VNLPDDNGPVVVWRWRAYVPTSPGLRPQWRVLPQKMDHDTARRWAASNNIDFESGMRAIPDSAEIR
jgi:hypothetical protein